MKKILVPTDFSDNANHALDYAIQLAQNFGGSVHILHTYHTTSHAGHLANIDRVVKEDREKELKACVEKVLKNLGENSIEITGRVRRGEAVPLVLDETEKVEADVIIMGTLGASNAVKKVLGSTASNIIKNTPLPVLAVPSAAKYADLDNLVVALDALNSPSPAVLEPMISFAQKFDLKINLVHVSSGDIHTDIDPSIKDYLTENAVGFSYSKVQADNVMTGILGFAEQKGNCVLCLISRHRGWFENLFHSSVSQKVALVAQMPLLILHDAKP